MKEAAAIYSDMFHHVSPADSDLWLDLFLLADRMDPELASILQYLRNAGTRLVEDPKWGYKLVPCISDEAWKSEAEYRREAEYLKPYRNQLVFMLKKLRGWNSGDK